jgi:hypothetical protein
MNRIFILTFLLSCAVSCRFAVSAEPTDLDARFKTEVEPLLRQYCHECHGAKKAEGEFRLDVLRPDMVKFNDGDKWHEVLNKLNVGEMPPEEAKQPTAEQREKLTDWLTDSLRVATAAHRSDQGVVFRRLNRREYNNTLNDLFNIDLDIEELLPPEGPSPDGFFNNGESLVISPLHLEYYLKIARLYLQKTVVVGAPPEQFGYKFEFDTSAGADKPKLISSRLDGEAGNVRASLQFRNRKDKLDGPSPKPNTIALAPGVRATGTGIPARQGPKPMLTVWLTDFPGEGNVLIRVKAAALETKNGQPPYLGVVVGNLLDDGVEIEQVDQLVAVHAKPDAPQTYEFRGRLENLPLPFQNKDSSKNGDLNRAFVGVWNAYEPDSDDKSTPRLAVHSIEFVAPHNELSPPQTHRDIFLTGQNHSENEEAYAREIFTKFIRRAYRRPAVDDEVERLLKLWRAYRERPQEQKPAAVITPKPGIRVDYFEPHSSDVALRTLAARKPTVSGTAENIIFDVPQRQSDDEFALRFSGQLAIPTTGDYTFYLTSDDGSRLYIDGKEVIDNDGLHGSVEKTVKLRLKQGWHDIVVTYFDNGGGDSFQFQWSGPKIEKQMIPTSSLSSVAPTGLLDVVQSFEESIRDVLPAALISPAFLYLVEPSVEKSPRPLSQHQLASRLSYFLWSTMPDKELDDLADTGKLNNPAILRQQVRRMLADDRSEEFIANFVDQWLELEALDRVAVNRTTFRNYTPLMKEAMREETHRFFREILRSDKSALNLIDSDFLVVNPLLAQHYKIPDVHGAEFRVIKNGSDGQRGGLLTQGSILTGNANGEDSHPIKRGVWLLKKLLNAPPPPPPPNVPDLNREDPKLTGLPLKEQLELHRDNAACNNCHRKIDPWGIPFENYNAVGQWREKIRKNNSNVIASDQLPDGTTINGIKELKQYLLEHKKEQFANAVTAKLLSYALGKSLHFADNETVELLSNKFEDSDYRLASLIEEIVTSKVFMTK